MLLLAGMLGLTLTLAPGAWFVDVSEEAGIPSLRHGEGVNAVDVNCDAAIDLYLPCVRESGRLLLNLGNGHFEDATATLGPLEKGGIGAAVGDINGDARPDLYITRGADPYVASNLVYLQAQDRSFQNGSDSTGVSGHTSGLSVVLADFSGDGWRDAFIPGWGRDLLLRNDGHGRLIDVSQQAGFTSTGRGWSALASDFDNDGHLDIFATYGSYTEPHDNHLYRNRGDGTFIDITEQAGLALSPWSLGAVSADFDNDGDFDLYVTGYAGPGKLYRNEGGAHFTDVSKDSGLMSSKAVGVAAGPIEGDFLPDLAIAGFAGPVQVYKNLGNLHFTEVIQAGLREFNRNEGLTLADLDSDGDLDLYVSNVEGNNRLYRNRLDSKLFIKIVFDCSAQALEGSVARLSRDGRLLAVQELAGVVGLGQGPQEFLFRLPDSGPFDLELTLPDGRSIKRAGLAPGVVKIRPGARRGLSAGESQ